MELAEKIETLLDSAKKNKARLEAKREKELDENVKNELTTKIESVQKWGIDFNESILQRVLEGNELTEKQLKLLEKNWSFYMSSPFYKKDAQRPSPAPQKDYTSQMKFDETAAMTRIASNNMMLALSKVHDYLPDHLKAKAELLKKEYLSWQMTQADNKAVAAVAPAKPFSEFEMPF